LKKLARDKHCSLLGPLIGYKKQCCEYGPRLFELTSPKTYARSIFVSEIEFKNNQVVDAQNRDCVLFEAFWNIVSLLAHTREVLLKGKAQYV
jgi:hypothetical protein